ncbi:hypothetical protein VB773_15115 [Haloarculaceae archaeon H-GB2-1]|nr:hypothetical protein [Haloarculaceae archaeon H-GB1-1]MEA5387298.1 hypothetical protein [Haloarculaceae archaeon H-GB11]MEA5408764.1 hypothetical protein [Haloarculaceae archaeon H-GB2-1]
MAGYYDYVLGMIPIALAGITVLLAGFGFSLTTAVPLASVVSVALIGHAMFVSPPTDDDSAATTKSATSADIQVAD